MEGGHRVMDAEAVFDAIARHTTDAIMLLDRDSRILFINQTAPGLTVDEVVGTRVYDYVPPEQHPAMRECFARVLRSGETDSYDNVYSTPSGDRMYYQSRVAPMREGDEVTGFIVLSSDVTEERNAAAERDRLHELSLDLICVASLDGHFRRMNPASRRLLGYEPAELVGRLISDFVHPDDVSPTSEALERLGEGAEVMAFENRYRHRDGRWVILQWYATAELESGLIYAIGRDVTQRRALEAQLLQSQKLDAIGQLAGGIAHDFNNLMLAILANVDMGRRDATPQLDERLRDIERAADRATSLTRQLLTFSRREEASLRSVDLNQITATTIDMLRRLIPASIEVTIAQGQRMRSALADPTQVEQVLLNLCLNARDAIHGAGEICLETSTVELGPDFCAANPWATEGHYVMLSVRDTGTGMAPDTAERAFEPFFTTKGPDEGTGLGLSTVYGIVQQHGGLIHVDSELGRGTEVRVYFPVAEGRVSEPRVPAQEQSVGGPETILVAEDEELVRKVVVTTLEQAGYRVVAATDGLDAVELMSKHADEVSLLLLDVVMPRLGGPEAYRHIHARHPQTPVLFTSGYSDASHFGGGLPEGTEIVAKPYSGRDLLRAVRAAIAARPGAEAPAS